MSEPLPITPHYRGESFYFQQYVTVGGHWLAAAGRVRHDDYPMNRLLREAAVIASALAPADTVERQMALAVLAGDDVAALALADRLVETRRAGEDMWGGLLKVVRAMLARMNKSGWRLIDYDDELTAIREAVRKAEGK